MPYFSGKSIPEPHHVGVHVKSSEACKEQRQYYTYILVRWCCGYSWMLGRSFSARTELFRLAQSLTRPATDSGPSRVIILGPQRPRIEPGSARSTRLARVFLFARDELRRCARYKGPVRFGSPSRTPCRRAERTSLARFAAPLPPRRMLPPRT
jgi:hypothetical protein